MRKVYLATTPNLNTGYIAGNNKEFHRIICDELELAQHLIEGWSCYELTGIKKIESVETTVIEAKE